MKFNSIINRYIFKEMVPYFVICLVFLTFIFLMTKILDITNLIVNYRVTFSDVLLLLIYSFPFFLEFTIPMSVMIAVLLTFLRMANDNEIIALRSGGAHIYYFIVPVFVFCLIGCLLTGFIVIYGIPWGEISFKELTIKVASSNINVGLKPRTFNDNFENIMLYVSDMDIKSNTYYDIFIEDQRNPKLSSTVIAPKGILYSDPEKLIFTLKLFNGTINQVDIKTKSVHSIKFNSYDINLDVKNAVASFRQGRKNKNEMTFTELKNYINSDAKRDSYYYKILIKYHEKFSIPFACIVLGLISLPIALQSATNRGKSSVTLGFICFVIYYLLLALGWSLGKSGKYAPAIGLWMPNIVIGSIGVYFILRTAKEKPLTPSFIKNLFQK